MSSFTRYAAVAVVVLSLGFLVASAPTTSYATVPAITGTDPVSLVFAKFFVNIEATIKFLPACGSLADLEAAFKILIVVIQNCVDELVKIGVNAEVAVDAQTNIATCVAATITLFLQVCVELTAKFGLKAVIDLCTPVDVVLRALLFHLNVCVDGIIALIVKLIAPVTVDVFAQINLKLCLAILGL